MTIDEYLNRPQKLKKKSDRLYKRLLEAEARLMPRDPLNLGDGSQRRTGENVQQVRLTDYIDLSNKYKAASKAYHDAREELENAIDYLLYWQGCLITHVYIYNVTFEAEDALQGADEILRTKSRQKIRAKLDESKAALAELLRAQGITIE